MDMIDPSTGTPGDTAVEHSESDITERLARVTEAFEEWHTRGRGGVPRSGRFEFANRNTVWIE